MEDDLPHHLAAAALLITDRGGHVLMVATDFRDTLVLPGGIIEPDEPPAAAAEREVLEDTGLYRRARRLLVVQHIPPRPPLESVLQFVFDAEPVEVGSELTPQAGEVQELIWLDPEEAARRSNPPGAVRLRAAIAAPAGTGRPATSTADPLSAVTMLTAPDRFPHFSTSIAPAAGATHRHSEHRTHSVSNVREYVAGPHNTRHGTTPRPAGAGPSSRGSFSESVANQRRTAQVSESTQSNVLVTAFFQLRVLLGPVRRGPSADSSACPRPSCCGWSLSDCQNPTRQPGRVGSAQRDRLGHHRPDHRNVQDVGLQLHQGQVVALMPPSTSSDRPHAGVGVHRVQHLPGLPGGGLQHRAGDVRLGDVRGQPDQDAAGVLSQYGANSPENAGTR